MSPSHRKAVTGYLQTFLLIGIATGATGIVFGVLSPFVNSSQGAGLALEHVTIVQGSYVALEVLTVVDLGAQGISSVTVSTSGAPGGGSYCYVIANASTETEISTTCPTLVSGPGVINIPYSFQPGVGTTVEIEVTGASFALGSLISVTVTASSGAQASVGVEVAAA